MLIAFAGLGIVPFGDNSLALSDGNCLYINYMGYVARAVHGSEDILFSFEKGLGGNMAGSWGWFLLNPTFALFALTDTAGFISMYSWVVILNFALCGLAMYVLLKDIYGHKTGNLIFSTAYALNGFLVANVFQLNFFSTLPALPIMVMGLRRLVKGGNPAIYIAALAYAVLTNFYFGFMVSVASVLIFLAMLYAGECTGSKVRTTARYAVSSLIAGAISFAVWFPALLSLRGGRLDQQIADAITFKENMPFIDMFSKLFSGANSKAELQHGLPNIFVGILPVFLVILFFMSKGTEIRRKKSAVALIGFYLVSFYIAAVNIAMHGGTVTNWFNYRDSFVLCFILIMVAAEEWQRIAEEPRDTLLRAGAVLGVSALVVFSKKYEFVSGTMALADMAVLALMYGAYRVHKRNPERNTMTMLEAVVLVLMCTNLYLNLHFSTKEVMDWSEPVSSYMKTTLPVSALVESVGNGDPGFYRMEIDGQRTSNSGNDPMLYGYYGVSHSGSDDRYFVRSALSKLGIHRYDMRNYYGEGIPSATDSLLGLRYIISKRDIADEKGYAKVAGIGDWSTYMNPYALPVSMVCAEGTASVGTGLEDVFDNLNRAWSAASGVDGEVFHEEDDISFSSCNVSDPKEIGSAEAREKVALAASAGSASDDEGSESGSASSSSSISRGTLVEEPSGSNYIKVVWTADRDGAVYSYNAASMTEKGGSLIPALSYEGRHSKDDRITRYIKFGNTAVTGKMLDDIAGKFRVAYADDAMLAEMSDAVKARPVTIAKETDSHLTGTFECGEGEMLLFTIPYDEGWSLEVDGEKADIEQVLGVFMAARVQPGKHAYELRFVPSGAEAGAIVAAVGTVLAIAYCVKLGRHKDVDGADDAMPEAA